MKTQLKLVSLAALTASTLPLPVAAAESPTVVKCAPVAMGKCGVKKCTAKCEAKCAPKDVAKCSQKCAPKH